MPAELAAISDGFETALVGAPQRVGPFRLVPFLAAWASVVVVSFLMFNHLIGGSDTGQAELDCTRAKLEALWNVRLPPEMVVVASVPGASVASADWDLKELGCSGRVHPSATLELRK